jgi:hypothetical protein
MPEWSSYNYGYCNPITWTDPTGMQPGNGDTPQVEPVKPIYGGELAEVVVTAKAPDTVSGSAPGAELQQSQLILSPQQGSVAADALSVYMYRPLPEQLFESEGARMVQLTQEQLVQNPDVLNADVYGVGHMGPRSSVQRAVGLINQEYSNAVGDNIRGGFFGALGYTIAGDRGSFVGAGVDNAAAAGAAIKGGIPQKPVNVPQPPPNTGIGLVPKEGSVTLYRAVSQGELNDMRINGIRNANGYETGKLFATSPQDAANYGRLNFGFDRQPFTIIQTSIPNRYSPMLYRGEMDLMQAVSVPKSLFNQLSKPNIFNYTPLPNHPLIRQKQ